MKKCSQGSTRNHKTNRCRKNSPIKSTFLKNSFLSPKKKSPQRVDRDAYYSNMLLLVEYDIDGKDDYDLSNGESLERYTAISFETKAKVRLSVYDKEQSEIYPFMPAKQTVQTVKVYLEGLYSNNSPPYFVREMLCILVKKLVDNQKIDKNEDLHLVASGNVKSLNTSETKNEAFFHLVKMYERMGFKITGTQNKQSYAALKNNDITNFKNHGLLVYMSQPIKNLLHWCLEKF